MAWLPKNGKDKCSKGPKYNEPEKIATANQFAALGEETGTQPAEDHHIPNPDTETVIEQQLNKASLPEKGKLGTRADKIKVHGEAHQLPKSLATTTTPTTLFAEDSETEDTGIQHELIECQLEPGRDNGNKLLQETEACIDHITYPSLQEAVAINSGKKGRKHGRNHDLANVHTEGRANIHEGDRTNAYADDIVNAPSMGRPPKDPGPKEKGQAPNPTPSGKRGRSKNRDPNHPKARDPTRSRSRDPGQPTEMSPPGDEQPVQPNNNRRKDVSRPKPKLA